MEFEGRLREARESLRRYFSLSPLGISGGWTPFKMSRWLKEWDVARKEVDEYIARRPDDPFGYSEKAKILVDGYGDLGGAQAVLEDGMRLPDHPFPGPGERITMWHFWDINYLGGNYQEALAGADVPNDFTRWTRKAAVYSALSQHARARVYYDSALAMLISLPDGLLKHVTMARVLARRGDHQAASTELKRAGNFSGRWEEKRAAEEAYVLLAILAGDTSKALSLLEQLIPQPGFLTVWRLRLDPVYKPLRGNPRFQAILAKYQ
jgi:hypothetical protein